jgi:hypothetical protein
VKLTLEAPVVRQLEFGRESTEWWQAYDCPRYAQAKLGKPGEHGGLETKGTSGAIEMLQLN